jgi:hypothetical protein
MYRFEVHLHAAPQGATFDVDFETVAERLVALPRMFFEPDGSFVWVSDQGAAGWQVDGVLYDRAGRVQYAELKGSCPAERFDQLLAAFGWPATAVLMQWTRQALVVEEAEFRRVARDPSTLGFGGICTGANEEP